MQYTHIVLARFCSRPNRFIAEAELPDGSRERVHVKNTGRCRELLINMDAQAPNQVFGEWARTGGFVPGLALLRPETAWGNSRFDFYWEAEERRGFVEVKGVTLEEDGAVFFPDAPTERGVKHVEELMACRAEGYEATLFFVVQMENVKWLAPNDRTHPAFGAAVRRAAAAGVKILAHTCCVRPDALELSGPVPVRLDPENEC